MLLESKASAATALDVTYINFNTIEVTHGYTGDKLVASERYLLTSRAGDSLTDGLIYTPEGNIEGRDKTGESCIPSIVLNSFDGSGFGLPRAGADDQAVLYLKQGDGRGSNICTVIKRDDFSIRNYKDGSETFFNWVNADVLEPVGLLPFRKERGKTNDTVKFKDYPVFIKQPNGDYSNAAVKERCASYVDAVSADFKRGRVHLWNENDSGKCSYDSNFDVNLGNFENASTASNGDLSGVEGDSAGGTSEGGPALECKVSINPLNWLLCGAVNGMVNIVGALDKLINSLLSVGTESSSASPTQIFGGDGNDTYNLDDATAAGEKSQSAGFYNAWATVRNISLGLMVLVGLTIIIAQALGTELVDAYTLRKALPRFIIAAIAITLSWQLLQFLVTVTNQLGLGIRFIIYQPFTGVLNDLGAAAGSVGGIGVYLIGSAALYGLGIFGLLSFAATAALALFVAFLILVLRQIIIIVLIIFAPIAIAAYVLPNTQKFYKIWWESLEKALLMFPLIAAMIASGRVFSAVALSDNPNAIEQLIGFAAYFAPYFAIPFALKFAGGALSTLGGMANNVNRGGFDRLKKYRGGKLQSNLEKGKNYQRLSDRNAVTRGINSVTGAMVNPRQVAGGIAGIRAGRQAGRFNQGAAALKADPIWAANDKDDNFLLAVANEGLANEKLDGAKQALAEAEASGDRDKILGARASVTARQRGIDSAKQVSTRKSGGTRIQALNALAQSGYQFDSGDAGYDQLEQTVRSITGSDQGAFAAAMDTAQFHAKGAGRLDLGGINHGSGKNDMKSGVRKLGNYGRGQGKVNTYHGGAAAWMGGGVVDADGSTKSNMEMANSMITKLSTETDPDKRQEYYGELSEWHGMLLRDRESATDANKLEINKQISAIDTVGDYFVNTKSPMVAEQADFTDRLRVNRAETSRGGPGMDPSNLS